ncbi:MAG: hypothetical protein IMZ71_01960 [Chloroflexi bacterium]|nr:hypothetical protein [Chloroflexota bacterium]
MELIPSLQTGQTMAGEPERRGGEAGAFSRLRLVPQAFQTAAGAGPISLPLPCRFLAQTPGSALQSPVPIGTLTHAVQFNRVYPH